MNVDKQATLLFRVDAGQGMGTGHVMRCLALAQSWQDAGGHVVFFLAECPGSLEERLRRERIELRHQSEHKGSREDALATARLGKQLGANWIVVDGYQFDADFHQCVGTEQARVLAIDDGFVFSRHSADLILNQNPYAQEDFYLQRESTSRLLLGERFLLLRREFVAWRDWPRRVSARAGRLLVTLGGADPDKVTLKALQALSLLPPDTFEATVLVGAANPHLSALQREARSCPCEVHVRTETADMPAVLAEADLAITAGGTTTWEMAFMGLPAVVVVLADNQKLVAETAAAHGTAINLGWHAELAPGRLAWLLAQLHEDLPRRRSMARAGQQLIDGAGVERVRQHLLGERLRLRRARLADAELLWAWANDPEVRSRGFHLAPISWQEHVSWLTRKLGSLGSFVFVAVDADDVPVGQLRLDASALGEAIISVSVGRQQRGGGWGTELIKAGTRWGHINGNLERISAYIKPDNGASLGAFRKAGYQIVASTSILEQPALHLIHEAKQVIQQAG